MYLYTEWQGHRKVQKSGAPPAPPGTTPLSIMLFFGIMLSFHTSVLYNIHSKKGHTSIEICTKNSIIDRPSCTVRTVKDIYLPKRISTSQNIIDGPHRIILKSLKLSKLCQKNIGLTDQNRKPCAIFFSIFLLLPMS